MNATVRTFLVRRLCWYLLTLAYVASVTSPLRLFVVVR